MKNLKFIIKKDTTTQPDYLLDTIAGCSSGCTLEDYDKLGKSNITGYDLIFVFQDEANQLDKISKELKQQAPHLPVIIISTEELQAEADEYIGEQIQDFLINEAFTPSELQKTVKNSLRRHKAYQCTFNELDRNRQLFKHISSSIEDVIYEWDVFANQINWSDNVFRLSGYQPHDLSNIQKWMSKTDPEELKETTASLETALSGNAPEGWTRTYQIKKASGEFITVEDKTTAIKNGKGQVCKLIGVLTDVTKKIEANARVARSEDNYTRIFNQGPMAMLIFRLEDQMIINVNKPALDLYQYPTDKLIGKKVDFLVSSENIYAFHHALSKIERNGEPQPLGEWTHVNANEDLIEVEVIGRSIDIDGARCVMISCNNISMRVKALNDLKRANEQFELVKQATKDVIWDYDAVNDKLTLDDKFHKFLGYSKEELDIDITSWKYFLHPKDIKEINRRFIKTFYDPTKNQWSAVYRVRKKDDSFATIEDHGIILRDEEGKPVRALGSMRDISDRLEKEKELNILESSLDQISDSILITENSPIDKPGPRIVYANDAFYRLTGFTPKETIGNTPRMLQGEKTDRSELDKMRKALERVESCTIEVINYKKNGEEFFVEITVDPVFDKEGNCTHFTSVQRDITERKERESEDEFFKRLNIGLNKRTSTKEKYEFVISLLADYGNFDAAEGWMTTIDNDHLQRIGSHFKYPELQPFFNQEELLVFSKNEGLPGTAWKNGEIIIWNDLLKQKNFLRKKEIKKAHLNAAVAIPIFGSNENIVGVTVLYKRSSQIELSRKVQSVINLISERFGSELQRIRTERELSSFFNITPDIMCVMSKDGWYKKVNTAFVNTTGYSFSEAKEAPALDFVYKKDRKKTKEEFRSLISGNKNISDYFESRYVTKSGEIINLAWSSVYDPDEKVVYAVARNITKHKGLQEAMVHSNNLQKHVINSTEDYIWAIDRNHKLILANEAYLAGMKKQTGKDYEIGKPVISKTSKRWAIEGSHKQIWRENYKKVLQGNDVDFIYDVTIDGEQISQHISMRPITSLVSGELPVGVACFSKDISKTVQHTHEIEEKNRQLTEIAHIQAHNVRAPLCRIQGLANLLISYKQDSDDFDKMLNKLLVSANELDKVIRDVMNKTYTMDYSDQVNKIYKKSG